MNHRVLKLDEFGSPLEWITLEDAIKYHATDQVAWEIGSKLATFRGGINKLSGIQSVIQTSSIVAIKNANYAKYGFKKVLLTNELLFARDLHRCAYCGKHFQNYHDLSRDHIVPIVQGGKDTWLNVITSCKRCNNLKGDRTPEQANLPLCFQPFVPSWTERMILTMRSATPEQSEFLKSLTVYDRVATFLTTANQ
jgi:hypothetical protein